MVFPVTLIFLLQMKKKIVFHLKNRLSQQQFYKRNLSIELSPPAFQWRGCRWQNFGRSLCHSFFNVAVVVVDVLLSFLFVFLGHRISVFFFSFFHSAKLHSLSEKKQISFFFTFFNHFCSFQKQGGILNIDETLYKKLGI